MNLLPSPLSQLLFNARARSTGPRVSGMKLDPSRTGILRSKFTSALFQRFQRIRQAVREFIVTDDALGLAQGKTTRMIINANEKRYYQFATSKEKLRIFRQTMEKAVAEVLEEGGEENPWTSGYVNAAFKKGLERAFGQVRKRPQSPERSAGAKGEFIAGAVRGPEAIRKVEMMAARTFEGMKGLSSTVKTGLNRELVNALTYGQGVTETARNISKQLNVDYNRALRIARTEIIHAHAEGQLTAFAELGIDEVGAEVEWSTAGDGRVCPQCAAMQGKIFKVKDAEGLIPLHPNCRCSWIPYIEVPKE